MSRPELNYLANSTTKCVVRYDGQWKKSRGISCSFRDRKIFIEVTTCRGRGHIVSAELQADTVVTAAKVGSGYVKYLLFVWQNFTQLIYGRAK